MIVRHRFVTIAMFFVAGATAACAHFGQPGTTATVCYPSQCSLDVKNDQGLRIGVRYYDSTGAGDLLGSVAPASFERFVLPRRTGRNVTLEVTLDKTVYRAKTTLTLPRYQQFPIHFPGDFHVVESTQGH